MRAVRVGAPPASDTYYSSMARDEAEEHVVLVDEHDRPVGSAEKMAAHREGGRLHRAFSVFLFNAQGQMLLQRRSVGKYHFGGLWTNACCSHPGAGRSIVDAARARLREELGIDVPLRELFSFVYRAEDPVSGLTEHEFDHVLVGRFDGVPTPDPDEVGDWKWVDPPLLAADVAARPANYTPWFKLVLDRVLRQIPAAGI